MQASHDRELAVRYGVGVELMKQASVGQIGLGCPKDTAVAWVRRMNALPAEDQIKIAVLLDEMSPVKFGMDKESRFIGRALVRGAQAVGRGARATGRFLWGSPAERAVVGEVPEQALQRGEQAVIGTRPVAAPPPGGPLAAEGQVGMFDTANPRFAPEIPVSPMPAEPFVVQRQIPGAGYSEFGINTPTGTLAPLGGSAAAAGAQKPLGPAMSWVKDTGLKAWDAFQKQGPVMKALTVGMPAYDAYMMASGQMPAGTGVASMLLPFIGMGRGWGTLKSLGLGAGAYLAGPRIESALYGWKPKEEEIAQAQQQGYDVGTQQGMGLGAQQGMMAGLQQGQLMAPQMPYPMQQAPAAPEPPAMAQAPQVPSYFGMLASNPNVMASGGPAGMRPPGWAQGAWGQA